MSDQTSSEPFDMTTHIARVMQDPERAARIAGHREEIALDRERYLERSMSAVIAGIKEASGLAGAAREAQLAEVFAILREDPEIAERFVASERRFLEEARDAMMYAADPFTGVIPEGFVFPMEIQAAIDTSPELQAYRLELVADAQERSDEFWAHVAHELGL